MPESTPFRITETSNLAGDPNHTVNDDGTKTVGPDDGEVVIAEFEAKNKGPRALELVALGAVDHAYTKYSLYIDNEKQGTTRSPLGLVNHPYSLLKELGVVYPANHVIEYKVNVRPEVKNDSEVSNERRYAARMFVNETEDGGSLEPSMNETDDDDSPERGDEQ